MSPRIHRTHTARSDHSSSTSTSSDASDRSQSTAPTVHSVHAGQKQYDTVDARYEYEEECFFESCDDPRESNVTYASTLPSSEDLPEEPLYEVPTGRQEVYASDAVPSSPQDFARLYPSCRKLQIRHDDATIDGNMNLRVDTEVPSEDGTDTVILFHLKMQDLKNREFSLRRYCRDSGREVCHSSRKYIVPSEQKRPGFQRSLSNAFSSITSVRSKTDGVAATISQLKRQDSGYDSGDDEDNMTRSPHARVQAALPIPTNTIQLEFSNYAHVDVKRRGTKAMKRYECEYWGVRYMWKREVTRTRKYKEISFHLVNMATSKVVAHITPLPLSPAEAFEEATMGGWIPPCSAWISDPSILRGLTDVGDVIIATGLIALVDDCIKRRWHNRRSAQLALPAFPVKSSKSSRQESSMPKRFIDEVFGGRWGQTATQRSAPSRQATTGY